MAQLTSLLAAGLGVALACDVFLAPSALTSASALGGGNMVASADTSILKVTSQEPLVNVDRSRKGDRLAGAHTSQVTRPDIAKVEFAPGGAILLRDRMGETLFGVDPAAQRTVVAKNVALPQLTIDSVVGQIAAPQTPAATPTESPAQMPAILPDKLRPTITTFSKPDKQPDAKRPSGCEPAFSPITAPQLGHIYGRCVTSLEGATKLALAN